MAAELQTNVLVPALSRDVRRSKTVDQQSCTTGSSPLIAPVKDMNILREKPLYYAYSLNG